MVEQMAYTASELMACVIARDLKDGEVGGVPGVRSEVPLAAVGLARRMHAPNLCFYSGAVSYNTSSQLCKYASDYNRIFGAEATFTTSEGFDSLHRGERDFQFCGGMQVDKYGNANLVCLGDWKKPKLRGPGSAGLSSVTLAKRYYLWINEHTKRVFVDKVDFISAPGYISGPGMREKAGIKTAGPKWVVTPIAIMDFDPETKRMRLKSIHPGTTLKNIQDNTGFELIIPPNVPETLPPTETELHILRTQVDPDGLLRYQEPVG